MKILVTGGAGLIGSNLVKRLVHDGNEPIVADNLWRGRLENLYSGGNEIINIGSNFFQYDLREYENCLLVTHNIDAVIHLADIVAGINFVFGNELFVFRENNLINSNMLNAAIQNRVTKYIYIGTACSYPVEKQSMSSPLLKEEDAYPANPESAYGWSKLMGEYECELAQKEGKIAVSILRLHNVYGAPSEMSPEKSQVIPALCMKALKFPTEEFIVWGSGRQRRAFLHVDDVVDAIVTTLNSGMGQGVIQIGPRESHSIAYIAEKIVELSGKDIEIRFDSTKPEGDQDRKADNSRAQTILNWYPKITLDDGLTRTYSWASEYFKNVL